MLTLSDISSQIGGTLEGNPGLSVSGPSEPKFASEQQLAMALSNKYINEIGLGRAKAALFTKQGCLRIIKYAFEYAKQRGNKSKVTSITKSNAQAYGMVMWDNCFKEVYVKPLITVFSTLK